VTIYVFAGLVLHKHPHNTLKQAQDTVSPSPIEAGMLVYK
jgi:hypothetical protein